MKKARGCYETGKNLTELGDERLDRCPLQFIRDHRGTFNELVRHHNAIGKGMLPEAGSLGDQPALTMEAIQWMDQGLAEVEAFQRKKRPAANAPGAPRKRR